MGMVPFRPAIQRERDTAQPKTDHLTSYPDGKIGKMPYEGVKYRSPVILIRSDHPIILQSMVL